MGVETFDEARDDAPTAVDDAPRVVHGDAPADAPYAGSTGPDAGASGPAGTTVHVDPTPSGYVPVAWDDAPTTLLDLRAVFAAEEARAAQGREIFAVEQEHPARAAALFLAALVAIAALAGGTVVGAAKAGQSAYKTLFGPPACTAADVADGTALTTWARAFGAKVDTSAEVTLTGCTTVGAENSGEGSAASLLVRSGDRKVAANLATVLRRADCTLARTGSGKRGCVVKVAGRSADLEARAADPTVEGAAGTVFTVSFR